MVGRLAQEMGITVRLAGADPTGEGHRRGTIAFIDLPNALLSTDIASDLQTDEKASEAVVRRTDELDAAQSETGSGTALFAEDVAAQGNLETQSPAVVAEHEATDPERATEPEAEPVAPETTTAGFPKRSKGRHERQADAGQVRF